MINDQEGQEKEHIEIIRDSPKNKSRVTIEYQFDVEKDSLGSGGYGEVYKVKKKRTNMTQNDPEYALKIFNKVNFYNDSDKSYRVLTEIKIQRSLNHEHVVKYEHSFEDKKNVYILMEYCGKGTLNSLIKSRKYLEEYEIRYYMFQVLSVLKYFRREKIVHRDLTLGNIFLKDIKTVKIGDFGFAYKESENEEKQGVICGTPGYFTPESNMSKYSYKTDIFDFGLCIYYLYGAKPIFKTSLESAEFFTNKETLHFDKKLNFSEEAIDLLNQTITIESQRIDLDKIYNHPFFNGGKGLSKDKFPEYNEANNEQFMKEIKELPYKEGLIMTLRKSDQRNVISFNPQNMNKINLDESNSNSNKIFNDSFNISRNNTGQSGKNVTFNINTENLKTNKNSNLKNSSKTKERNKEKEKENSKNQEPDNFLENLTKTLTDKKVQNELKELDENIENIENIENNNNFNNTNNNKTNEEIKTKRAKNKIDDNDFDFNNTLAAVTFENENEFDKYRNRKLIYINKIYSNYSDNCGIGYQLNNNNIGVYFNDNSQILKVYNNNKYILYFYKGFNSQNIYNKKKIELPIKNKTSIMTKKIKFLLRVMEYFILNKKKSNKPKEEKENLNEEEENIIIEKYRYNKHVSLFSLSNKNIQVNFKDKSIIIFVCSEPKKIVYIDENDEKLFFQIKNNNFNNFKCEEQEITNKIYFAISQINK